MISDVSQLTMCGSLSYSVGAMAVLAGYFSIVPRLFEVQSSVSAR